MDIDVAALQQEDLLELAKTIEQVLDSRTHKRIHLGDPVIVKGSLSKVLKLPEIQRWLSSTHTDKQAAGRQSLAELWVTLSSETQDRVIELLDWYDPKTLSWEDPRSNRYPRSLKKSNLHN